MLFNTNLREADSGALSRYLHRYCDAPAGRSGEFEAAGNAYERIRDFLRERPTFVDAYRRSARRTSAISVEIRKDLVWRFEGSQPVGPIPSAAARIGGEIARGIATFLAEDFANGPLALL